MAADDVASAGTTTPEKEEGRKAVVTKKRKGLLFRIWNGLFRTGKDDFEKRLEHISKEEAAVLKRKRRRSITWRRVSRHFIIFSVFFELIAVGYAILTTRSVDLDWKRRAVRILPMFLLPGVSSLAYLAVANFFRLCDRRDQKTVERLRAERQAKIDELKERTNYYITQKLIQKYDPDPAAKAAAATVLASKLGADSGLNVLVGDESKLRAATGKSNDAELAKSSGLRNRKQPQTRSSGGSSSPMRDPNEEMPHSAGNEGLQSPGHSQLVVEHQNPQAATAYDGGWISRIAALLVGEDPTQSYALICGNCHMHNGLARKEDFPYITYYCPHCHALNQSKQSADQVSDANTPNLNPLKTDNGVESVSKASGSPMESVVKGNSPDEACSEIDKATERVTSGDLATNTGGIHG